MEDEEWIIGAWVKGKFKKLKVLEISSTPEPCRNFLEAHLAISGMDPGITSGHPKGRPLTEWSKTLIHGRQANYQAKQW